jgi:hypothetical protein
MIHKGTGAIIWIDYRTILTVDVSHLTRPRGLAYDLLLPWGYFSSRGLCSNYPLLY